MQPQLLVAAVLSVTALPGCLDMYFEGGCGLYPGEIHWDATVTGDDLHSIGPDWIVERIDPSPGIPHENTTFRAWNATVSLIRYTVPDWLGWERAVWIDADGLHGHYPEGRRPVDFEGVVDRMLRAVASAADMEARHRMRDAFLASETAGMGGIWDHDVERERLLMDLHVEITGLDLEAFLAATFPDLGYRAGAIHSGPWTLELQYPRFEVGQEADLFRFGALRGASYTNATWAGEFPESEALASFEAAYARLGIGPPPERPQVSGSIC